MLKSFCLKKKKKTHTAPVLVLVFELQALEAKLKGVSIRLYHCYGNFKGKDMTITYLFDAITVLKSLKSVNLPKGLVSMQ